VRRIYNAVLGFLTGSLYRHHKGGVYRLVGPGTDSTNGMNNEPVVVYCSLDRPGTKVRAEYEWRQPILWPGGELRPRFERICFLKKKDNP